MASRIRAGLTAIALGAAYLLVVTPVALLRRALGRDPMRHGLVEGSYWKPRAGGKPRELSAPEDAARRSG